MEAKYELYGTTKDYFNMPEETRLVAKFSTRHKAQIYIKHSMLKTETRDYKFKANSLLRDYIEAFIEPEEEIVEVPIDPEYKERK